MRESGHGDAATTVPHTSAFPFLAHSLLALGRSENGVARRVCDTLQAVSGLETVSVAGGTRPAGAR